MYLGVENEGIFTDSGRKFMLANNYTYSKIERRHIRRALHPFWDAIEAAGFRPSISNGSVSKYTGYFLNASI